MNHKIKQKKSELKAIELLVPHIKRCLLLSDDEYDKSKEEREEPDFIFRNRGKSIGIEVRECHPSVTKKGKSNAPIKKNFKEKICDGFKKNEYLLSITQNDKLRIILDVGDSFNAKIPINEVCHAIECHLKAWHEHSKTSNIDIIRRIHAFPTKGKNIVHFNYIGRVDSICSSFLRECIEAKDKRFHSYKKQNCTEYWLCIYLPWEEYKGCYKINYDEPMHRLSKVVKKSYFDRICITSFLINDLRWLKGDPNYVKKKNNHHRVVATAPKKILNLATLKKRRKRLW